ncbi:UNVERIFIED_CONTAM: hypothetical protein RMT77_000506 [Armadillidium vulgare]
MSRDARAHAMGGGTPPPASPTSSSDGCGIPTDPTSPITLAVPRPEHQRSPNVYVDVPFQHRVLPRREEVSNGNGSSARRARENAHELPLVHGAFQRASMHRNLMKASTAVSSPTIETSTLQKQKRGSPIISQPSSITFTKGVPEEDSIICSRCGRCRCEACSLPRPPSGAWVCGGKCHVSPSTAVDYLSCLCCVKGVLYHCGKDSFDESSSVVDRPCSCSGSDAVLRWACMALAALPLPCLFCYWPLRGVRALFEKTYERFTTQGCKCRPSPDIARRPNPHQTPAPTEKRLLHDCA